MNLRLPICVLAVALAVPAASADDTRTLFKHDKGTYEKTGKGKWVEKRGDDTFELKELRVLKEAVHLRDDARKLNIFLSDKEAQVRKDGQPVSDRFAGKWVAAEQKDPDPKPDPADAKVPPVPVPKADKTVWKHDAGHFEKTGDDKWVERTAAGEFTWTEKGTDPIKVVLEDTTRKLMVEIKAASALVRKPGQKISDGKTLKGEWVKVEVKTDLDPRKDGRTVWKAPDVTFELSAPGVWTETNGRTVKKYTQKAVTEDYVELLDDEFKLKWVRLTATARQERLTELNKYKAEGRPGGWVKVPGKPDPKARYAEVAKLAPEQVEGGYAISPDGKQVARRLGKPFAAEFGVVEAATGKVVQKWKDETSGVTAAVWSGDGKTFATYTLGQIGKDGKPSRVVVRDATTWEETATFELTGYHTLLALSADGSRVACASGELGKAVGHVFEVATKREVSDKALPAVTHLSADGKTAGGPAAKGGFALFDVATGKEKAGYAGRGKFVMSADAGAVAEVDYTQKDGMILTVWEGKGKTPRTIRTKQFQAAVTVFLDDAKHLAVAGHSFANPKGDVVKVFNLKTLAEADSVLVGKETDLVSSLYLFATPDSSRLLTFGIDKYIRVWSTPFGDKKDDKKPIKP